MHVELDSIDLGSLDENNKPVVSRLRDVTSALGIFENLRRADEKSSAPACPTPPCPQPARDTGNAAAIADTGDTSG